VMRTGSPEEVFGELGEESGQSRFERTSVLTMTVKGFNAPYDLTELHHSAGTIWLAGHAGSPGEQIRILIKATDIVLSVAPPQDLSVRSALAGHAGHIEKNGPLAVIQIHLDGDGLIYAITTRHALDELGLVAGARVFVLIKTSALDERKATSSPRRVKKIKQPQPESRQEAADRPPSSSER